MNFADLDLSQSAFLDPRQLLWSESKSDLKFESSPTPHQVFYADTAVSYAFDNDSSGNTAVGAQQLFASQPQRQPPSEMLSPAPQQAKPEMEMEGDLKLRCPCPSPPHGLLASAPAFVHTSGVMSPSPPAFGAHVPYPRLQGSSSPTGLMGESDEDLGSESGEGDTAELSDSPDGDFLPNRTSRSRTRSRRTSSVGVSSSSGSGCPT